MQGLQSDAPVFPREFRLPRVSGRWDSYSLCKWRVLRAEDNFHLLYLAVQVLITSFLLGIFLPKSCPSLSYLFCHCNLIQESLACPASREATPTLATQLLLTSHPRKIKGSVLPEPSSVFHLAPYKPTTFDHPYEWDSVPLHLSVPTKVMLHANTRNCRVTNAC